jgi:transcriptional regulator with XRE-family HTH domain
MTRTVRRTLTLPNPAGKTYTAPNPAGKTYTERQNDLLSEQSFAKKLNRLMVAKGWRQTDLAKATWGDKVDEKTGKRVVNNRDRLSNYINGKQFPDPVNLTLLANALGVSEAELAPDLTAELVEREEPEVYLQQVAGHSGQLFNMKKLLPSSTVLKILTILEQDRDLIDQVNSGTRRPARSAQPAHNRGGDDLAGVFDTYPETVR